MKKILLTGLISLISLCSFSQSLVGKSGIYVKNGKVILKVDSIEGATGTSVFLKTDLESKTARITAPRFDASNVVFKGDGTTINSYKPLDDSIYIHRLEIKNLYKLVLALYDSLQNGGTAGTPVVVPVTGDYFVSPTGLYDNTGTIDSPINLAKLATLTLSNKTVVFRGGVYNTPNADAVFFSINSLTNSKFINYPGEVPIIDGSNMTVTSGSSKRAFDIRYWTNCTMRGIEFRNFKQQVVSGTPLTVIALYMRDMVNCNFQDLKIHNIGGVGIGAYGTYHSGNTIRNCDIYYMYDSLSSTPGGAGDAVTIRIPRKATSNRVVGCRFYEVSDDGIDLWSSEGIVEIDSCWAWKCGYIPFTSTVIGSGGAGFKMGRTDSIPDAVVRRIVKNSYSFNNRYYGIHQNDALVRSEIHHNVFYGNGVRALHFGQWNVVHNIHNNISYNEGASAITSESTNINNSWNTPAISIVSSDFLSLDVTQALFPRSAYGTLPDVLLFKPKQGTTLYTRFNSN